MFDASYLVMGLGDVYLGAPVATPVDYARLLAPLGMAQVWETTHVQRLAPVSQEMTCNFIAQQVLGLPRSY